MAQLTAPRIAGRAERTELEALRTAALSADGVQDGEGERAIELARALITSELASAPPPE
jgi:hypothetical protein